MRTLRVAATTTTPPEVWLRGPVDGVPPALQPVAHSLLQVGEELRAAVADLGERELWLLFHAAENAQRHAGQAVTTARIVRGSGL